MNVVFTQAISVYEPILILEHLQSQDEALPHTPPKGWRPLESPNSLFFSTPDCDGVCVGAAVADGEENAMVSKFFFDFPD